MLLVILIVLRGIGQILYRIFLSLLDSFFYLMVGPGYGFWGRGSQMKGRSQRRI